MRYPVFSFAAASVLLLAGCGQPAEQKADQPAGKEAAANAGGQVAPAFQLASADGKQVSLADFRGKTVVLEWTNEGCPYVKKHYSGAMQKLQKEAVADGVVWLTIVSSAPGEGRIIYAGGIDDKPTNKVEDLAGARNFVRAALDDHAAERPVTTAFAQPYGCAIKYADEAASTKT